MTDPVLKNDSIKDIRNSRRRRWDQKATELYEDNLKTKNTFVSSDNESNFDSLSHNHSNISQMSRTKFKHTPAPYFASGNTHGETTGESDILSSKLSAIINNATDNTLQVVKKIKNNQEISLRPLRNEGNLPTAPPFPRRKLPPRESGKNDREKSANDTRLRDSKHKSNPSDNESESCDINVSNVFNELDARQLQEASINLPPKNIYHETMNGFILKNKNSLRFSSKTQLLQNQFSSSISCKSHAVFLQTNIRSLSIFCQGILAGLTLAHCLMVFLLAQDVIFENAIIGQIFYSTIVLLSSISLLSSLERYDMTFKNIFNGNGLRIPWSPFLYIISFTISLCSIGAEDVMQNSASAYENEEIIKMKWFTWWKYMVLLRTCFSISGWISLAKDPQADALAQKIIDDFEE